MPKMFVHSANGTFDGKARTRIAAALTDLGMDCERLPDVPAVRRGVWVFFAEYESDAVFSGGQIAADPVATLIVYALVGGLDESGRRRLIKGATAILGEHALRKAHPVPAYVAIQELPESHWGMYGDVVSLAALRRAS